jgi:hypothetical protein
MTITKEIAAQFLKDPKSVDLSEFSSVEDAAAQSLAKFEGDLSLNGLKSLSAEAAICLASHKGNLSFEGLEILTDEAAAALSKHEGVLRLITLTSSWSETKNWQLSEAAAASLALHNGEVLLNSQAKAAFRSAKLKNMVPVNWNPVFLKEIDDRWTQPLSFKDDFKSPEELLATLVSQGNSSAEIYAVASRAVS